MPYQGAGRAAALVLEDGRIFPGSPFGAPVEAQGEVVFTTCMTGYQEIATDPSFRGQLVCLTYPIIGNYGVTPGDDESRCPWVSALIVRDYVDEPSHWHMTGTLDAWLKAHGIPGIAALDTRALTRHIRTKGLLRGVLVPNRGAYTDEELIAKAQAAPLTDEIDAVGDVSAPVPRDYAGAPDGPHVVVLDCGLKENIVRSLVARGARVTVVPHDTPYAEVQALEPDGVICSPGPGDPENADEAIATVRDVIESGTPYAGICLGHQLLALAIGAHTDRLPFGHRGGNHPVLDLMTGQVRVTSQNHGFRVLPDSIPTDRGWRIAHLNLNDGSVEGLVHESLPVFTIQYHPEGSPGPQDSQDLFDRFLGMLEARSGRENGTSAPTGVPR
jgi:carbamoyl-phosphate synthase small subunit